MRCLIPAAALAVLAPAAWAQDDLLRRGVDDLFLMAPAAAQSEPTESPFLLAPAGGYLKISGADDANAFGGLLARWRIVRLVAVEALAVYHEDRFLEGDVKVAQTPLQVSALVFPFPHDLLRPYAFAGAGWYRQRIRYRGALEPLEDETDAVVGAHAGAGLEIQLGPSLSVTGDARWVSVDPPDLDTKALDDKDFDRWQITVGLGLHF